MTDGNIKRKKKIRADIILIVVLLIVSLVLGIVVKFGIKNKQGSEVIVKCEDNVIGKYSLDKNADFMVKGYQGGYNHIIIKDGKVWVEDADCSNHLCIKTGKISKNGETIVCLPHRITICVEGGSNEADSTVQ